ncbi:heterokaryon incompatibility protein-domain-containing protein [Dendryphion nanum]|uniref:Heterokaryon incompatibility protein-domain-containing protein n=1 Tax=Dendryphion nanum TaxID=256645 RepID=A0A9P9IIS7_9PLEO|nr:heterokaryon incompatibility protein-domain-containing protein [Dendryphion nanum]
MKLCDFCMTHILEETKSTWGKHHESYASLEESAAGGCLICNGLKGAIVPELKKEENQGEWPVYRWSIRCLARIRESPESVVITFRFIPRKTSWEKPINALPTKSFYMFPEEDLQPLPTVAQLSKSTNPTAGSAGQQIRKWFNVCNSTHINCNRRPACAPSEPAFIPTRLIDVTSAPGQPVRVVEKTNLNIDSPYITLSHCWGKDTFVRLLPTTYKQFTEVGVPWDWLTTNFAQAIEVTRFLGIKYIWIDSLCIIQGPNGDWANEAGKMHQVYRNSYCNIAVVDSKDDKGGLYRKRRPDEVLPFSYQAKSESAMFGNRVWKMVAGDLWETELMQTPLYKRGWVFQERMLAPRILHFAEKQILWDCSSLSACETLPAGLPQPLDGVAAPDRHWRGRLQLSSNGDEPLVGEVDDSLDWFWKTAVRIYTSCALTKGSDKLIAMWGIAKLVRDAMGTEYGDGLWEEDLENQLTWRVAECTLDTRPNESQDDDIKRNIPSWSWASMDGVIEIPDKLTNKNYFKVKDHHGRALAFDLVGVKRFAPARPTIQTSPIQTRGMSDSKVELVRRERELHKENETDRGQRTNSPEKIDRNAEPKFHDKSIPIQAYIGRGRLTKNETGRGWILEHKDLAGANIEAFPDTKPAPGNSIDEEPFFVLLSAKQVKGHSEDHNTSSWAVNIVDPIEVTSDEEHNTVQNITIEGNGILMKNTGGDRFRRTGAISFHNVDIESFKNLEKLARKFWLY